MSRGSATTDSRFAYFTPGGSNRIYRYEWSTEKWESLRPSIYQNSGLVVIDGTLTTVGGHDGSRILYTLQHGQWIERYPQMNMLRSQTAVVSTADGKYIFAIGGYVHRWTATVELFHVKNRLWYELAKLPRSLQRPSAAICGNQLHVIGVNSDGYSCSLQALQSHNQIFTVQSVSQIISWTPLPRQPVKWSTAATLRGQLIIIGGERERSPVKSIHQLVDIQWKEIGSMSSGRIGSFAVTQSSDNDKLMIVGGEVGGHQLLDSVEECVIV